MNVGCLQRIPIWTALLCGLGLGLWLTGAATHVQYDRGTIAAGQWWRSLTCHWAHWSVDHLFWDAATFGVLGLVAERRSRIRFLVCIVCAAPLITAGVWLLRPDLDQYRGLSGIDSALFSLVATGILCDAVTHRRRVVGSVAALGLAGFALKSVWEITSGSTLFVDAGSGGFESLPLAHAVGAGVGLAVALWPGKSERA